MKPKAKGGQSAAMVAPIRGCVDAYTNGCVTGWAYDPVHPDQPVRVEVWHNGQQHCEADADVYRKDLETAGLGDGRHGFEIAVPLDAFPDLTVRLHVRVARVGGDLEGSPITLRNDRMPIDATLLATLSRAVRAAAAIAQTPEVLNELSAWLIEHSSLIYQRQIAMAKSAQARAAQFNRLIRDNMSLPEVMRQSADAVVARYPALSLPEVTNPVVSIIIPAYGHFHYTYQCLKSIVDYRPRASIEVIVIDDCSTDETVFAGLVLFGGFRILRNAHNEGFVRSVSRGASIARGNYLFLLNNDCEVRAGWVDALLNTFDREASVGVAGSKLVFPHGRLQEVGGIIWRDGTGQNYGRGDDPDHPRYCFMRDADYVSGAALMARRTVFDTVGGLSTEFAPGYYEDTDFCFKVRAAGHRVVVQPQSIVTHHEGVTAGTDVSGSGMKRFQIINRSKFLGKWFKVLQRHELSGRADSHLVAERLITRRALFIDDTVPTPDQDAGSNAALAHMRALQRIGYKVSFVGADNMAKISPYTDAIEALGIECYYAPFYGSVEDILRRVAVEFDVFYIHRLSNMVKYAPIIREYFPAAFILYSMADLQSIRLEREADVTHDQQLRGRAARIQRQEAMSITAANSVIVHSSFEQQLLAKDHPEANVHVLAWSIRPEPVRRAFIDRSGLAFVGGYNHTPNVDAARWLVNEIMPLVWAVAPKIECVLIGSNMPREVMELKRPRVRVLGHVPDLLEVFEQLRLTVAPLRFGAGLKGKVLTSLAAGLPCVSTPCGVEGMNLPEMFGEAIGSTANEIAERIIALHADEQANGRLALAGLQFVSRQCSEDCIDEQLQSALRPAGSAEIRIFGSASNGRAGGNRDPDLVGDERRA